MATFPFQAASNPQENRRIALICAKGGLDECYPVLIMANAARMVGIDTSIFFTFYGLDVVTKDRVDHLYVNMVGKLAMKMFGRTKDDLLPEVEDIITATDFFERTVGADIIFV
jgi:peroxiredoxin family protein